MPEHACGNKQKNARVDYPGNVGENDLSTSLGSTFLNPDLSGFRLFVFNRGPVAQLGARFHGMEEVVGSIPTRSTKSLCAQHSFPQHSFRKEDRSSSVRQKRRRDML